MLSIRHILFLVTIFLLFTSVLCSDDSQPSPPAQADRESFQRLLSDVSDDSIHSVLHSWAPKFQDGVFSKDRTAIEAVHSENARLATRLVQLAKRQGGGNSTATTPTSQSTPSSSEESSSTGGIVVPSTTSPGVSTSTTVGPVSTPSSASAISTGEGGVVFSSNGGLTTVPTSSKPVTYRPFSSTVLSTTTLADGSQSTQTSFTVVNAPDTGPAAAPTGDAGVGGSGNGSGNPSLQTGSATAGRGYGKEVALIFGGAVAVAMAM